jgi:hypothetical protein
VVAEVVAEDNLVVVNLAVDNLPQAEPLVVDKLHPLHLLLRSVLELQLVQAKQPQLLQLKPQ